MRRVSGEISALKTRYVPLQGFDVDIRPSPQSRNRKKKVKAHRCVLQSARGYVRYQQIICFMKGAFNDHTP